MKKLYILAIALLSAVASQAQTIKLYQDGEELVEGATVTIKTYSSKSEKEGRGVRYTLDAGITMVGSTSGSINIVGTEVSINNSVTMNFQVCPHTCTTTMNGVVTNTFDYDKSVDGELDLEIHNISSLTTDVVTCKDEYDFTIAYTNSASSKRTFKLVFDFDSSDAAGVNDIAVDNNNAPVKYFNLNGVEVNSDNLTPGLYIRRQGTKATKVAIR
jgi:hypothetical protein